MFIKNKHNQSTLSTLTGDVLYSSAGRDHIGTYIVKDVCIHNPENINNWESVTEESHYCMLLLLQQFGLYWLAFVI